MQYVNILVDLYQKICNKYEMTKLTNTNKIQALELRLEDAIHMIRLASKNERTCLELEEWLNQNYPTSDDDSETIALLLNLKFDQLVSKTA